MAKIHKTKMKDLSYAAESAIVSYRREEDGRYAVIEGHGNSISARVKDADSSLPPGTWTRLSVSTPSSVYSDLVRFDKAMPKREGVSDKVYVRFEGRQLEVS